MKKFFGAITAFISAAMLLWFLAPAALYGVVNAGNIVGVLICACLFFRFGLSFLYKRLKSRFYAKKVSRIIFKAFIACAAIFAIYATALSSVMVYFSFLSPSADSRATAVVLGAQVRADGPSVPLRQRIDAAEEYLSTHDAAAVVTGGQGDFEPISEAQSMFDNMTADGIDADRIFIEDKATNTAENIRFSKRIIEQNNLNRDMAIVTDSYHQLRARIIAQKEGASGEIYAVSARNTTIGMVIYPTMFVREWIAIPVELIK